VTELGPIGLHVCHLCLGGTVLRWTADLRLDVRETARREAAAE
jgi:hypothetical protein